MSPGGQEVAAVDQDFERLLEFLRENRGFDFTGYKRPSLKRRISKRMHDVGVDSYAAYLERLAVNEDEFAELFDTILINVTGFFRDPASWEYLRAEVVPRIVEAKAGGARIRVWSAGCATGEEAYSAAIVLAEAVGADAFTERVKIYATDVDEAALRVGRHGTYASDAVEDVPQDLRDAYFERTNGGWAFRGDLRRCVIFGRHDLVQDPPISRVDLLLARNTLMYFGAEMQQKILADFHFALNPDGYLFLGKSEVPLARSPLFQPVDLKRRIFTKVMRESFRERLQEMVGGDHRPSVVDEGRLREAGFDAAPVAQIVLDPSGLVALANIHARRLFGLSRADFGRPLQDLELSYRPLELRSRIEQAYREHHPVSIRDVEWHVAGEPRYFDVHIGALSAPDGTVIGTSVTYTDVTHAYRLKQTVEQSKERLETAFAELQSTAEELETTNEELQSTNEELETTNEELQSTNEELETMNEELQSTNEELETMNDELRQRTDQLDQVNAFLESILGSIKTGIAVVDRDLVVQAWNDHAFELWGVRAEEVDGWHLLNLDIGLPLEPVATLLRARLADGPDGAASEIVVDAVNRRGRPIRCRVGTEPLVDPAGEVRGVIVHMNELPAG